jgi:hypothetical protein
MFKTHAMTANGAQSTPDGSPEPGSSGARPPLLATTPTFAQQLANSYGKGRLDDAELTVYVLPWEIPTHPVQVAVFSTRLIDGGEEFEIEIASFAMPSQLGLKDASVNSTILGVIRTGGKAFELPNDLADCIFVGLHQLRAGRDLSTPLADSWSPAAEPTELARHAATRFSAKSILRAELLAIPTSRWKVRVRESVAATSQFETALQLINEDPYEAKIVLSKSSEGLDETQREGAEGNRQPRFALTVSNHPEAERAAADVTTSEAQEWFESIMAAINDNRRRYQRGIRVTR